jgi:integrase
MRLTDLSIRSLKPPPTGRKTYFDDQIGGFGIRVSQRSKSFVVVYGQSRKLKTLGKYPALSLKDARKEAQLFLLTYSPLKLQIPKLTYSEATQRFLDDNRDRLKTQTIEDYSRHLAFYDFTKPINQITRIEILDRLKVLVNQPVTQNHTFDTLVNFFNWALRRDLIERHPLQGERKPALKHHREHTLSADELKAVYQRAEQYPFPYGHIVRLLILTGQRRSEILHLRWENVGETLQFLDTKNRTDHEIPLMPMAKAVIDSIPHRKPFLFQNTKPVPFSAFSKAKITFDKPLQVTPYRLHDLRRTFSSNMAMLNVPLHVTERILNHKSGTISGVSAIYNRYSYIQEMKTTLETYEQYLAKILSPMG